MVMWFWSIYLIVIFAVHVALRQPEYKKYYEKYFRWDTPLNILVGIFVYASFPIIVVYVGLNRLWKKLK